MFITILFVEFNESDITIRLRNVIKKIISQYEFAKNTIGQSL